MALANISFGTPRKFPQTFIVATDFFSLGYLILIDWKADLDNVSHFLPDKNTFNSSNSSTFTGRNVNFTSDFAPSIVRGPSNLPSVLNQIVGVLDAPVITIWNNNTNFGNGSSAATIGAIDTEHCKSNWIFVPQVYKEDHPYSFHVSSVEMTLNGTNKN
uniref:Uncharacterized protein n=1 Tax=Ditylenchus dipsaci TaxID=166011 RepID=A0A915DQT6_9BILA